MGNCDLEGPPNYNYDFQQRLLHYALTTGHYNLWTRGKEWKKKVYHPLRYFSHGIWPPMHKLFAQKGYQGENPTLTQGFIHNSVARRHSLPPRNGGTSTYLHMLKTPICLFWVPCKHYKYHVLWLTQGLWHPNLAYPRLNITTKKRGLAEEVKVPVQVSVHPGPLTSFNTIRLCAGDFWYSLTPTLGYSQFSTPLPKGPQWTNSHGSVMGPQRKHLFCWVLAP
jgi:hypothetical protein